MPDRPLRLDPQVEPVIETTVPPAPGPGGRVGRTAGQLGGAVVFLDLVFEFGWLGADGWTVGQASAVTACFAFGISALHNLAEHVRSRRATAVVVDVEAA